jgi:glycine/D-amino acid oxidase-like deaminating enzyme/nitrite reductase/ring-hydroxylating ferredoxin subunit
MTRVVATTSEAQSLWLEGVGPPRYPPATAPLRFDVAVLGGGIAGLTTALLLKREGLRVAVLEAERVGCGATGNNTAKVTALQSTVLTQVRRHHGAEGASEYASASRAAVEQVADLVEEEGIACDLSRAPAATYAFEASGRGAVEEEFEVARDAGLDVELTESLDLPFPIAGAVRLDDQVRLDPVRYTRGLARSLDGDGSHVFEQSRVEKVGLGSPFEVQTADAAVTAEHVVVATHYPLLDRGLFFARMTAQRSYCIAARVRGDLPETMAISTGDTTRSLQAWADQLIVGGEGHETGAREATPERFLALERFAREHWEVHEVTHRWSAQDPVPHDHLPMVGAYHPRASQLWVATGFLKWGLTAGTFAAMILRDLIAGGSNPWAKRMSPARLSLRSLPEMGRANVKVAAELIGDRLRPFDSAPIDEIPPGQARILRDGMGRKGVYRHDDGTLHAVSLRCTHLGCLVRWNGGERSWDCPCHGSRFDVEGRVLEGPAVHPLERLDP